MTNRLENAFERMLFASRWILAPLYFGMALALVAILVVFAKELYHEFAHLAALDAESVILLALSLIDLSLTGNLLLIVIFAGYENFVSKMHIGAQEDRPGWMGTVDFSDLKIKLVASIVAISAIALLRAFLPLGDPGRARRASTTRLDGGDSPHLRRLRRAAGGHGLADLARGTRGLALR